ncbi:GAF domain-containing sensor histidine kinase [Mycobacterium sp. 852002-51057_SCH5723018]|uniref:GAF domain-containing sensor histidine kinase n=1 Tax=Mycobacterium sp. 852002-51057_SCH5723018 TaxID=1834094 RepID=UPI001E48954F|nr:GAF domain-containing protein [Mycobacterium sp. 852002-51057_SCH5723018]
MVAAVLIVTESLLVQLLGSVSPNNIFGMVYLLGVLVISAGWDIGLAVITTFVSAVVYLEIHLDVDGGWLPERPVELLPLALFVPIGLLANVLAGRARLRALAARHAADQVSELAERQAALRRVATLVARGVSPSAVFTAVADEVAYALRVENCVLVRYLGNDSCELVAAHDEARLAEIPVGARYPLDGDNVAAMVLRRGTTARMDSHEHATGPIAAAVHDIGGRSAVGAPIHVDGRLWGAAVIASSVLEPQDPHTEARLADFAELVATAVANAQARDELIASRARIVAAGDEARRRIERDLHDGAQQRLVTLTMHVRSLEADLPDDSDLKSEIAVVAEELAAASEELRQFSHGIHPAVLSNAGLRPALRALCRRAAMPVELSVNIDRRLPESVEVAAYYVVAEALTNATKHARASLVTVIVDADDLRVRLTVADDGVGGANPRGSGLLGLKDRVEALGGRMELTSRDGEGTALTAEIPRKAA